MRARRRTCVMLAPFLAPSLAPSLALSLALSLAVFLVPSVAVAAPPPVAPAYDNAFWKAWGDGQAEIDGYVLERDRYGEKRRGTVVAIFVTEPWSLSQHVK